MFDIGMFEMFVIVVLAIIVVGPRDLPKMLRTIGQLVRKVKALGQEFQSGIKQIADEVELEEVTRKLNEAGNIPLEDIDDKPEIIDEEEEKAVAQSSKLSSGNARDEEPAKPESDMVKGQES
ncbi:Sec-independent protein translocase protein TatB [Emcibacter nanhaiensis]|uniref:Sec-independent protein translocase protein TatB n=1 Tax=Emcibacter nanhaiensis TaxID=1505037 RepID=A0A501PRH8_9PROT|nr:Sec-independent protein translocase protein TatB [Emcibacter nanhaiensis]TPD63129.1 twin-arginine translocase subunit TatB [Emcibacter nanhaiensis]